MGSPIDGAAGKKELTGAMSICAVIWPLVSIIVCAKGCQPAALPKSVLVSRMKPAAVSGQMIVSVALPGRGRDD